MRHERHPSRPEARGNEGITANIFHIINTLAIEAIESGREQITDEAIEKWEPEFDSEAAFA